MSADMLRGRRGCEEGKSIEEKGEGEGFGNGIEPTHPKVGVEESASTYFESDGGSNEERG